EGFTELKNKTERQWSFQFEFFLVTLITSSAAAARPSLDIGFSMSHRYTTQKERREIGIPTGTMTTRASSLGPTPRLQRT
ncbi:hydroxyproline-rich glycoprotein, partial [Moniliophthora roreri]